MICYTHSSKNGLARYTYYIQCTYFVATLFLGISTYNKYYYYKIPVVYWDSDGVCLCPPTAAIIFLVSKWKRLFVSVPQWDLINLRDADGISRTLIKKVDLDGYYYSPMWLSPAFDLAAAEKAKLKTCNICEQGAAIAIGAWRRRGKRRTWLVTAASMMHSMAVV